MVTDRAAEIWGDVSDRLEEKDGITLEVTNMADFNAPNESLVDGSLDANAYQYIPFLHDWNTNKGENLIPLGYLTVEAMGIWTADGIDTLEDVPDGAQVSLLSDPVNFGNSLVHLEKAGFITLDPDAGPMPTEDDIIENPHNLEFVPMETGTIARSLGDNEIAVHGATTMHEAGITKDEAFYFEDTTETSNLFRLNFVVREEDADNEVLQRVLDEYQSQETIDYALETGSIHFYPGWENDDNATEDYYEFVDYIEGKEE